MNYRNTTRIAMLLTSFCLLLSVSLNAASYTATSLNDLQYKIGLSSNGDIIYLQSKTYSGTNTITVNKDITVRGVGGNTKINGEVQFIMQANGSSIENMNFTSPKIRYNKNSIIRVEGDNVTIKQIKMSGLRSNNIDRSYYVRLTGYASKAKVEWCTFIKSNVQGIMVHSESPSSGSGKMEHQIRHCYFTGTGPRANGNEALTLGTIGSYDGSNQVMYCIFDNYDSETEILSIKSKNNKVRRCLFKYCYGNLSLRGGHGTRIEENYFLNAKYNDRATYLNVWGDNHVITNNYFNSVSPLKERSWSINSGAISLMSGNSTSIGHVPYEAVNNVVIEKNIVSYTNENRPALGLGTDNGLGGRIYDPTNVTVRNNVFFGASASTGKQIDADGVSLSNYSFSGNNVWPIVGISASGVSNSSPGMARIPAKGNLFFDTSRTWIGPQYAIPTNKGTSF